jgi:indolepyruvate ferredoxin oxidoreductase beta subunit
VTAVLEPKVRLRPITIAILAMGGEGGGVLSEWTVNLAEDHGYYAQSTSVAGVAQRTGATVYYVELFPRLVNGEELPEPVLSTMPTPGEVDVVIASELMEAGRAIQRGFVTPHRTTLIASTSRTYSMPERTAMGDGRVDSTRLLESAKLASKSFLRGDFSRIADESNSVISAVLFGALCGAQVLPFTREQFESAIRASGKGVEASLRAFDGGLRAVTAGPGVELQITTRPVEGDTSTTQSDAALVALAVNDPAALVGPKLTKQAARIKDQIPAPARYMAVLGIRRTAEYQDTRYADEYLARLASVAALEEYGDDSARLTAETARYLGLWMTYEDTIRVAFHKTRSRRFDRVGREAAVSEQQLMRVQEYLHPQIEEISDTLPTALGRWVLNSRLMGRIVYRTTHRGIKIQTTSVWGFTTLYVLARLRPIRRRSLRFGQEQQRIESWLELIRSTAPTNYALACEIAECQQVVKGYGQTHANGMKNFTTMMALVPTLTTRDDGAACLAGLRKAALADEHGAQLQAAVAALTA